VPPSTAAFQGNFAGIRLQSSPTTLIGLSAMTANGGAFNGILLYQRRANMQPVVLSSGSMSLFGTIYAKWAPLNVAMNGSGAIQLIAGSLSLSGTGTLRLRSSGSFVKAFEIFLVE
jgi:hypothetical protein